jgi:hypothetical protein
MALKITDHQARFLRMSSQRLMRDGSPPSHNGAQVVKEVVGIQAQEQGAAFLSIQARNPALKAGALEHEFLVERSMIRSWFMRGTLHLVATEDVEWLLPLLSPFFINRTSAGIKSWVWTNLPLPWASKLSGRRWHLEDP